MGTRPTRMPRFAWSASADLVEPTSSVADDGFSAGYRPPAQWFNYLLHFSLGWSDYLRGPGWGAWTRAAHGGTAATFTAVTGLAVDTDDTRAQAQRYRYAITGAASGPTAKIAVSRNGLTWADRAVPTSADSLAGIAQVGVYWVTWGLVASADTAWTTPVHDGSSSSGIGTSDATYWTSVAALGGHPLRGVVDGGGDIYALQRSGSGQYVLVGSNDDGTTWPFNAGFSWSTAARATSIAYDDSRSRHLVASSLGEVRWIPPLSTFPTGGGGLGTVSGIPTDARVQLVVGGPADARTLLAWASFREDGITPLSATLLWRSTDGGTTWSAITVPTGWGVTITDVAHVDGTWIATQSAAPYLWRSDDDGQSWERLPLPVAEESSWALYRAVYADGQIVATGLTWTVYSSRASATSPGTWTSREPVYLADAGSLRGRTISTTAPTSGQALAWNAGTSQWEPTSVSSSPTTTRGDLIVRGASADQRLAVGASGRVLRSDGTDPAWTQLASTDVTGLPWTTAIAPDDGQTTDATQTTIATIATTTNKGHALDLLVSATQSDRSAQVTFKVLASVTNVAGTLAVRNQLIAADDGGASGWAAELDVSGTNIRVRVTGAGATTIDWLVAGTMLVHGS
jgi:hypothetical protein